MSLTPILSAAPSGQAVYELALKHVGERYVLGVQVPKDNAAWTGPWDCSEFTSWLVYQVAATLYGCDRDYGAPATADAFTGYWVRDAHALGTIVPIAQAAQTPGAFVLRLAVNGAIGHIVVSDGQGGTVEAHGHADGVIRSTLSGRRWDMGILVPQVAYTANTATTAPADPPLIYRLMNPLMTGPVVLAIQNALAAHGYSAGVADGQFGPHTQSAVLAFQLAQGLVGDGEVGPSTGAALGVDLTPPVAERLVHALDTQTTAQGASMPELRLTFAIDANDHLILTAPDFTAPTDPTAPASELDVESAIFPGASHVYADFAGTVDLGAATPGVYLVSAVLDGNASVNGTISISGLPGALTVQWAIPVAVTAGAFGYDISGDPGQSQLPFFRDSDHFQFAVRYVANPVPPSGTMKASETAALIDADIPLMLVQHPVTGVFAPDATQAGAWGKIAVAGARSACVPKGVTLFADLEEVQGTASQHVADFFNGWSAIVSAGGYVPGLYVGSNCVLDSDGLAGLAFQIFWRSASNTPDLPNGYHMVQGPLEQLHGDPDHQVKVDEDKIQDPPGPMMWLKRQP